MFAAILCSLVAVCGGLISAESAQAADAITVHEYVGLKRSNDMSILVPYMSGAADALWSSNAALMGGGKPPLYCSGADRPLSATQLIQLTDKLLADLIRRGNPAPPEMTLTTVSANAVVIAFACKKPSGASR
jgi:hypothetical protein